MFVGVSLLPLHAHVHEVAEGAQLRWDSARQLVIVQAPAHKGLGVLKDKGKHTREGSHSRSDVR